MVDGTERRFLTSASWGSANAVADIDQLLAGDPTVYTMWDGHALFGPDRPGTLERFPLIYGLTSLSSFLERYGALGADCEVWTGEEALGVGCPDACANLVSVCGVEPGPICPSTCVHWNRYTSECAAKAATCQDVVELCGSDVLPVMSPRP